MSFFKRVFSELANSNDDFKSNNDDFEDQFEFHYTYDRQGSYLENYDSGKEKYFDYKINVTIEFLWDLDKNMYEVNYYVSSDKVTDVDVPDDDAFVKDVHKDL